MWLYGAAVPWCYGAMVPWYGGVVALWCCGGAVTTGRCGARCPQAAAQERVLV